MKLLTTILILSFGLQSLAADQFILSDRLFTQKFFLESYEAMFGNLTMGRNEEFFQALEKLPQPQKLRAVQFMARGDKLFPAQILRPLIYWRFIEPNTQGFQTALMWHALNRLLILRDFVDHPLIGSSTQKQQALNLLSGLINDKVERTDSFFARARNYASGVASELAALDTPAFYEKVQSLKIFSANFKEISSENLNYSLSWLGFIPGNQVEVVSQNDRSQERIDWLNKRVIFNGGKLDWSQPYMVMPPKGSTEGHPVFAQDPIFQRIRDMIDSAQDSIFIDIFLFGGTMGATLARYLVDQTLAKHKVNPNFRTLLLHDYATNYNMKPEMMPIFEYIRDRIKNEPAVAKCFWLLQANIQRHPPGVPFRFTNLIPKTDGVFKQIEKGNTYFESKIDHSKVIVVDANTITPQAYFGSKNWSDHSGAYYYDDAIYVKGPAAALVQASYVDDVEAALTTNPKERSWFYYKEQGFGNDGYLGRRSEILSWMRLKRSAYPHLGDQTVRLAEANVDGRIKDVRNMIIDMIANAQNYIYMEELFIYDRFINDALIKRKIQNPNLDIRIIADHNGNFGMNGLPNTIFMAELKKAGIQIRARKTLGVPIVYPDSTKFEYHQENHRKILSVDGKWLVGGSSNFNPDTLQGSFREFGAQIFDTNQIARFERDFLEAWGSDSASGEIEHDKLILKGKQMPPEVSNLINDIAAQILRSKDELEKRFR